MANNPVVVSLQPSASSAYFISFQTSGQIGDLPQLSPLNPLEPIVGEGLHLRASQWGKTGLIS